MQGPTFSPSADDMCLSSPKSSFGSAFVTASGAAPSRSTRMALA